MRYERYVEIKQRMKDRIPPCWIRDIIEELLLEVLRLRQRLHRRGVDPDGEDEE